MNRSTLIPLLIGSVALAVPQIASATILVGFHDFDSHANIEAHDQAATDFSGRVIDGAPAASFGSGGSNDGTYGLSHIFDTTDAADNDGYLRSIGNDVPLTAGNPTIEISYGGADTYVLGTLLFDAAKQTAPGGKLDIWYKVVGEMSDFVQISDTLISPNDDVGAPYTGSPGSQGDISNYLDYFVDLTSLGLVMSGGTSIQFLFDMDPNGRLDNIALTAIPETSGVLALGCLIGAGALLRNRRSSPGLQPA